MEKVIFEPSKKVRVIIVGDLILDRYWIGDVTRISPEAPVPILKIKNSDHRAGGAANVANNIASLGGQVSLFGMIGDDDAGKQLSNLINKKNINNFVNVRKKVKTIVKLRLQSNNQQLIRADFESDKLSYTSIVKNKQFLISIKNCDLIILSDYDKGTLSNVSDIIKFSNSLNKTSIVDPKGQCFNKYNGATIITPNLAEFEAVVGKCKNNIDIEAKGKELAVTSNFSYIIVTKGSKGLTVIPRRGKSINFATKAKEVFDVTGAGDTVIATLGFFLALGLSVFQSTQLANTAAGLVVGKSGTATVSILELENYLIKNPNKNYVNNNSKEIETKIRYYKKLKKSIVFTNGCFDIIHSGHLYLLNEAKKLGNILIVGINDDSSIKKIKGHTRPVNNLQDRINMLSNLKSVDLVIPFKETTPLKLIKAIAPDVLVKGGDYKKKEVSGGTFVEKKGGKVIMIKFLKGFSSTKVIDHIRGIKQ